MRRPPRFVVALTGVLALGGCGLVELAYDNAPGLVAGRFDEAFDITDSQRRQLETRLETFFEWHREQELIRYEAVLYRAATLAEDGIEPDETLWLIDEVRDAYRRGVARLLDDVVELGTTLTPAQLDQLETYFDDSSEEYDDYLELSVQQRQIYRAQRDLKRLERWFGDFDEVLEARIRARLEQLPDLRSAWIDYRQARFNAHLAALRGARDAASLHAALRRVWLDPDTDHARRFEPARQAYWRAFADALADIDGWIEPRHRQRAIGRLRDYAETIAELKAAS